MVSWATGTETVRSGECIFLCDDDYEVWRAKTLRSKEPGTIAWLESLRADDVLFDIGANIGIYTIFAAHRLTQGHVYAFEPHVGNAAHLMRNIRANRLQDRVTVITTALHDKVWHQDMGYLPFAYHSLKPGSSGSQLGHQRTEVGDEFTPQVVELKATTTLSALIRWCLVKPPTAIKIDVDGNELDILRGLFDKSAPIPTRTIQVETHPKDRDAIVALLAQFGYRRSGSHLTHKGQKDIQAGADPMSITDNTIFTRAA